MKKQAEKGKKEIKDYISPIEEESEKILEMSEETKTEVEGLYNELSEPEKYEDAQSRALSLKRSEKNIRKTYSNIYRITDELNARLHDVKSKKNFKLSAPSNSEIDRLEIEKHHFAAGLNFYKMMLLCFLGSFFGVIIEMAWCILTNGYIESRAGLVYGPFNILYGWGAMLMTAVLYRFRNRNGWLSFFGAFIAGSALEYFCSWGQEFVLGSRSWDYSDIPFNINGRICLLYSIFWGILGVVWIKDLYPRMSGWILKIPNKPGKIITWIVTVFLIINVLMSGIALFRWSRRDAGVEASNIFWETIDERFPDERMQRVYANMEF